MAIELVSFDVNQTEFPCEQSKKIWFSGKQILPLEISLAEITDAEMREGCTQICQVTREILSDMYKNPEQYPSPYFDLLLNRFITFGAVIDENGYRWSMPSDVFQKYTRRFGDYYSILAQYGFMASEVGGRTILQNDTYPLFLKYWYPLFTSCQKHGVSLLSCDFRVFAKKYKLTIDDFIRSQADIDKAYFKELHDYAIFKGAKLDTHFQYRKFRYIYKSECLLIFENVDMNPCMFVPYCNQYSKKRNPWISFDLFMAVVEKQSDKDELVRYIQKEICVCHACSSRAAGPKASDECCGHWLDIYGVRRLAATCHPEISKCLDEQVTPGAFDYEVQMLKRMIDIRVLQIDNYDH